MIAVPELTWEEYSEEAYSDDWELVDTQMGDPWRWGHWELHVLKHKPTDTLWGFNVQVGSGDSGGWDCFEELAKPVIAVATVEYKIVKDSR